jgi:hypothetical protein
MRWNWTARSRARVLLIALLPDLAWVLVALGSVSWGLVAARVLPGDACSETHSFGIAVLVQLGLLVAAIALTLMRGAKYGMSGSTVTAILVPVVLLSAAMFTVAWLLLGTCWSSFTF